MTARSVSAATDTDSGETAGLVLANFGRSALVRSQGRTLHCELHGRRLKLVCGDRVRWRKRAASAVIVEVLPRRNLLQRIDSRGRCEPIAADIDRLAVVLAPQPRPDWFVIDRYLAAAALIDIPAVLIQNKCDLAADELQAELQVYRRLPLICLTLSAKTSDTLGPLRAAIATGATLLVGQSGVGKSSLINALTPDGAAQTAALTRDAQGRHTTSTARWYQLDARGALIDAPGVRDFAPPAGVLRAAEHGFVEILATAAGCRFKDCRHFDEPGCAVRAAARSGAIHPRRYESYRRLARLYESFQET